MDTQTAVPAGYHMVMFSFDGTDTASRVLHRLKGEQVLAGCEIEADATVSRDASGTVHFHERGAAGIGAVFGATTLGVIGAVGGPPLLLLMLVAGGIAGGVAGHFMGQVLPPEDLREVGESLAPGSSAYLAVVDAAHAPELCRAFEEAGARVLDSPIEMELSAAIREGITHSIERVQ